MSTRFFSRKDSFNSGDDEEFLQNVPYSSSSIDRSSIDSIPWADDAIKQNQLEWERVERMLSGEDELPEEMELQKEILEWQRKFPQLVTSKETLLQQTNSMDSSGTNLDIDSVWNTSINEETTTEHNAFNQKIQPQKRQFASLGISMLPIRKIPTNDIDLAKLFNANLRITSMPLRQRKKTVNESSSSLATPVLSSRIKSPLPASAAATNSVKAAQSRLRMPPILNVLETRRRFRGISKNCSFVQLTQVQQSKSAAVTHQPAHEILTEHQTAWNIPLLSNRFFNNRNSIVLPAINMQRNQKDITNTTTTTTSNGVRSLSNSSLGSGGMITRRNLQFLPPHKFNGVTTTTASTTPSTGTRSISAAIHHQRTEFNPFYFPFRAAKFRAFQ